MKLSTPAITPLNFRHELLNLKIHLLTGTSHMIPFIVAGGVLLSLAVMLNGEGAQPEAGFLKDLWDMGAAGFTLFIPILGGYIAWSMASRPGLAPGMIGAWLAESYGGGFLGAIVVGFIAGYIVNLLKRIPLPRAMKPMGAIFIYPLLGTFLTSAVVIWFIGHPIAHLMTTLNECLHNLQGTSKVFMGVILGAMTAFDMGGPVNKVATLFAQTQVKDHPYLMGGVGVAICTPPLGMWLATVLAPLKYSGEEHQAGKAALMMGMIGISEGAIPFAVADPLRVLPAIVLGGITGNIIGFSAGVINNAPWGGWIVLPVVDGRCWYIFATLIGMLVTAITVNLLKPVKTPAPPASNQISS
ncbi:PTS fructose transporter subunit IIC [Endozoicomonas euniceicola]|uniref:Fructose-specific PTS transporter subunit EIIC n=1 Tax=Endozoicomonas euniceicola TaxID=1234143 RepID=A0ABY6GSL6_9GAMM|nr:fructose-specific PTS transporter subunit EIIC [Endozoicomonas euniceicola]UYM15384.1 fructose-specific PTS transporter subunit EIIC [Endozoicomonas euniceicola]